MAKIELKDFTGMIEHSDGTKYWYRNGKLHREDGPAVEYANGNKEWYRNGEQLTEAEFLKWQEQNNDE